jgi:hypothetical protein
MRTYYRGPDAVVTSDFFVWRTTPAREFAIRDLSHVGIAHGPARWWLRRRCSELHARHRGLPTLLYLSHDPRVFNQVSRALRRAIEDSRPDWSRSAAA